MSNELQYKRAYDRLKMSKSLAAYIADDLNERLEFRNEGGFPTEAKLGRFSKNGVDYHIYADLIFDAVDAYYEIGL